MSRRYEDNSYASSENTRLVGGMGSDEGTDESSPVSRKILKACQAAKCLAIGGGRAVGGDRIKRKEVG